jgi:hypothetical protein
MMQPRHVTQFGYNPSRKEKSKRERKNDDDGQCGNPKLPANVH